MSGTVGRVYIDDTTLRDGEQPAGVAFTIDEKIRIARRLDAIGVDQIEAGTPAMGVEEQEAIRAIARLGLKASVLAWCRATPSDIDAALVCGINALHISLPVSDIHIQYKLKTSQEWVLDQLRTSMAYTRAHRLYVSVGAEDASRTDEAFLVRFGQTAAALGADRWRYCDTVGILDPLTTFEKVRRLVKQVPIPLEIHAHDDFGMATANTLAAVKAGATHASVTVNGLGERSGNAPLEEVVMALKYLSGADLPVKTEGLLPLCREVALASGRPIPPGKAIVGESVFAHESGIHVDGVLKNPLTYEPFPPEMVGLARALTVGKHSGSHALKDRFAGLGISLSSGEARDLLPAVRRLAMARKRSLLDGELIQLRSEYLARAFLSNV